MLEPSKTEHAGPDDSARAYRQVAIAAAVVFLVALAVRVSYISGIDQSPYYNVSDNRSADYFSFFVKALEIYEGDAIGEGVFNQSPLYPYFLAATFHISGGGNLLVPRLVQSILGSLTCMLVFLMGYKLKGVYAGAVGGLICALYGPLIFYDGMLLRTSLITFVYTGFVYSMFAMRGRPALSGIFGGVLFSLGILAKPNLAIMAPALIVWLYMLGKELDWKRAGMAAATFVVGAVLSFSPLVVRNMKAGVPAFSLTQRGALEFIAGNHPEIPPFGWQISRSVLEAERESGGSIFRAVPVVMALYSDDPAGLIKRQFRKASVYLNGYEVPNNVNYYAEKLYSKTMALPWLTWPFLLAAGLVGMWELKGKWREAFPVYSYVVLFSLGTIGFYVLSRFRVPVVPALAVFAGVGIMGMYHDLAGRRFGAGGIKLALFIAVIIISWPRPGDPLRPNDYRYLAHYHLLHEEPGKARKIMDRGLNKAEEVAEGSESALDYFWLAQMRYHAGAPLSEAEEALEKAAAREPPLWLEKIIESVAGGIESRQDGDDPKPNGMRLQR